MIETKKYDDVKFALAENLKGEAKEAAKAKGIESGLVAVGVKYGSAGQWTVEKVDVSPTDFIQKKAEEEGINLKDAFSINDE